MPRVGPGSDLSYRDCRAWGAALLRQPLIGICVLSLLPTGQALLAEGAAPSPEPPSIPVSAAVIDENEGSSTIVEASTAQPSNDEFTIEADELQYVGGAVYARGHVRVKHKEIEITGDEGEVDEERVWAAISGNVVIRTKGIQTAGTQLRINLDTEQWEIAHGQTKLEPEALEERVREPIFVRAKTLSSYPDADLIIAEDAAVTSCNRAENEDREPHYELTTDKCRIHLRKDVVLDSPALYALGRRILRYPGKLRLRMDEDRSRFIVELGQNEVEGFYVKVGYPYEAGRSASGLARLQLATKRGVGLGVNHWFDNGQSVGEISLFAEPTQGAWSTRIRHRLQVSRTLTTSLNSSLQTNSGYAWGTTTSFSTDFTVRNDTSGAHTALGVHQYQTSGSGYSSTRLTGNFTHQQRGPAAIDWTLRSTMQRSKYGSEPAADEELSLSFEARRRQPAFDWEVGYRQRVDLDGSRYTRDSQYYAMDEVPTLALSSDTERMGLNVGFPIQTRIEWGAFRQQPEDQRIHRLSIEAEMYGERIALAKGHELLSAIAFRQSFYSDGSAQYDLRSSARLRSSWGGPWYTQLQWAWEQPGGFTPLRIDYAAKAHDVHFGLARHVANRSRIEFDTGYDIRESIWRDLLMRAEFTPNQRNRFELQTAYDIENSRFRPLEARWQFVKQHRINLELSASYDIDRSQLGQVVIDSDWVVSPQWRVETLIGYNGALREFDFFETRITRDLHCWIASLAYSLSQKEIRFNIGLKALGGGDWEYGLGGRGEWLTPRSGQYY